MKVVKVEDVVRMVLGHDIIEIELDEFKNKKEIYYIELKESKLV